MNLIKNVFALLGVLALVAIVYGYQKFGEDLERINGFDPKFKETYIGMWDILKQTGNSADATVWVAPLEEGVSPEDAEEAMKIVANDLNIKAVGELPLSEQVEMQTGEKQRFLKIYQYCDPETAMKMVEYTDAFAAYLPCRVSMVEGKDGKYRLFSLNMDLMIHGGAELPEELKVEAQRIKDMIQRIMSSGAAGDFF